MPRSVLFFPSSLRLSCRVLSFSNNQSCPWTMISYSLSGTQTQSADTGQQLPMSGNRRAATSALLSLTGMLERLWLCTALCWWVCSTVTTYYGPLRKIKSCRSQNQMGKRKTLKIHTFHLQDFQLDIKINYLTLMLEREETLKCSYFKLQ